MGDPGRRGRALRPARATPLLAAVAAVVALLLAGCATGSPTVGPIPVDPGTAQNAAGRQPLVPDAPIAGAATRAAGAPGLLAPLPVIGNRNGPEVCEKFGSVPVAGGRFEVQNDAWGASTPQCTTAFDTGFSVQADHDKDSGPAAYPSIVWGCNYGKCTTGTPFPRPVSDIGDVRSSWAVSVPDGGRYNAAYDIWFDPTARRDGGNTGLEMMIWLVRAGGIDPIGSKTGTVQLAGATWDVFQGENAGTPVLSYVRQQAVTQVLDLPVTDFVKDAQGRGAVQPNWFLTNLQAGFEPWVGGTGLSTDAFNATRNGV